MVPPVWKLAWQILIKGNIDLPYNSAIAFISIYLRKWKIYVHRKKNPYVDVYNSFIHNHKKKLEENTISLNKGMNKPSYSNCKLWNR